MIKFPQLLTVVSMSLATTAALADSTTMRITKIEFKPDYSSPTVYHQGRIVKERRHHAAPSDNRYEAVIPPSMDGNISGTGTTSAMSPVGAPGL